MVRKWAWWAVGGGLVGAALLTGGAAVAWAQGKRPQPEARAAADRGKKVIELPTERALADAGPVEGNPRVAAGKVRWHPHLDAACQAAARSGKPVLVFHLLGNLDERFC